jgi:hypothetical protein
LGKQLGECSDKNCAREKFIIRQNKYRGKRQIRKPFIDRQPVMVYNVTFAQLATKSQKNEKNKCLQTLEHPQTATLCRASQ